MPGPPPKPPERRQRRNKRPTLEPVGKATTPIAQVPEPATDWRERTKVEWRALWSHTVASTFDVKLHEPALRRLFDLRDERDRLRDVGRGEAVVSGSMGQPVLNPVFSRINQIDSQILALEREFGLTVSSLLKLGINYGQARRSLDDLSKGIYGDGDEAPVDDDEEDDPRIIDITPREAPQSS